MSSIFTKIIQREIPAYIVAEDAHHIAFLDINPVAMGHTLVVPKQEVDYIFDMEDDAFSRLQLFAKKVAKGVQKAVPCKRVGVAVIGLEVPHTHIHLVPLNNMSDINFNKPKLSPDKATLEEQALKIKNSIEE